MSNSFIFLFLLSPHTMQTTHLYGITQHDVMITDKLRQELESARHERARHLVRNAAIERSIIKMNDSYDSTKHSIARAQHRKELTRMERLIAQNEIFCSDLALEINHESNPFKKEEKNLREQIITKEEEQSEMDDEIRDLRLKLEEAKIVTSKLQRSVENKESSKQRAEESLVAKQAADARLSKDNKKIQKEFDAQSELVSTMKSETELNRLETVAAKNRHATMEREAAQLRINMTQLNMRAAEQEEQEERKRIRLNSGLQDEQKSITTFQHNMEYVEREIEKIQLTTVSKERENQEMESRCHSMEIELQNMQSLRSELVASMITLRRETESLSNKERTSTDGLDSVHKESERMERELQLLRKEREEIETLKRESDRRQSHLESRMNETTSEVEAACLKMNSLEREREKMTKAVFQERKKLQDVKLEAATMKHELENQRRNRIEQELLVRETETTIQRMEQEKSEARHNVESSIRDVQQLEESNQIAREQKNTTMREYENLGEKLEEAKKSNHEGKRRIR